MPNKKKETSVTSTKLLRRRKVKMRNVKLVEEYCENSTVHGLRYFAKKDIHPFERYLKIYFILFVLWIEVIVRDIRGYESSVWKFWSRKKLSTDTDYWFTQRSSEINTNFDESSIKKYEKWIFSTVIPIYYQQELRSGMTKAVVICVLTQTIK